MTSATYAPGGAQCALRQLTALVRVTQLPLTFAMKTLKAGIVRKDMLVLLPQQRSHSTRFPAILAFGARCVHFHGRLGTYYALKADSRRQDKAEFILKWLGGWAGLLPIIFRGPTTKKRLESPSKTMGNQGQARKGKALQPKNSWQTPLPTTLKMIYAF